MVKSKIDCLITDFLSGNSTPEEEMELSSWRKRSPENEEYFIQFVFSWKASIQLLDNQENCFGKAHLKTGTTDNGLNRTQGVSDNRQRISLKIILKYAAIIIASVILGSIATFITTGRIRPDQMHSKIRVEAPKGSKSFTILPDGTQVWLNASSRLTYFNDYNNHDRIVMLEGEAFFHVSTNHSKPFYVQAGSLAIKALGTSFNVKAYPTEEKIITTLLEGKVMIEGKDDTNQRFTVDMKPSQCVTYFTHNRTMSRKDISRTRSLSDTSDNKLSENLSTKLQLVKTTLSKPEVYASWKDDRWIVNNEDLNSLAVMLERRYNVNIKFQSDELKKFYFTGTIQNESIEQVLAILCLAVPVKYEIDRNNIYLSVNKDLKKKYLDALRQIPDSN